MAVTLNVRTPAGTQYQVSIEPSETLAALRGKVAAVSGIASDCQRLIFSGRILRDEQSSLESLGINKTGQTIILVKGAPPQPASAAAPKATPAPTPAPAPSAQGAPFNLFGMPPQAMQGTPNLQQMQQQMMANPELMQSMLNSPIMEQMMSNPEFIRSAIESNPAMREVMERNPEVAHVLNDPALLRQTLQTARNPELMREMMRSTDRAMNNIESHPEGFNALRRMYTNVQEPMLNAAAEQQQAAAAANPFAALFQNSAGAAAVPTPPAGQPNNSPLPNPWAPQQPAASPAAGGARAAGAAPGTAGAAPGAAGAGAAGLGAFPGMGAGFDPVTMMQNPAVQQMMQTVFSNPALTEQLVSSNPMLQQMTANNPQLRAMLTNPDTLRHLTNPRTMDAIMRMQQAMADLQETGLLPPGMLPAAPPADWASMFGGMGGMGAMGGMSGAAAPAPGVTPGAPAQPPAERFAAQLRQLREMGFYDESAAIAALTATNGNVQAALERLLPS